MIELKNVSKFYKDSNTVTVGLRNINLKLNKGELVAITGDSGSGKSTLLNVISLIDSYDEGEVLFYGNETFYFNQNDSDAFRKENVSFIFQKYNIIDSYTVLQNVMLPLIINGVSEEEAKLKALDIIKRVGLEGRVNNRGTKLSGGEKQRCVIARALANDTPILACDEPTGNLDSKTSKEIIELIKEVSKDKLVLIVTHDYDSIKDICTRKIKMSDGEIVEDITYNEGIQEDGKELVLQESKPLKKTLFKLALANILSTPKKTIFSTMVFSFVACIFMMLSLLMIDVSYDSNYTYNDSYGMLSEDRMIIYDINQETLDINKIDNIINEYEYYENAFYEELEFCSEINYNILYSCLTFHKFDYEILEGVDSVGEDEFVLVLPEYMSWSVGEYSLSEITGRIEDKFFSIKVDIGNVVGIGTSEDIDKAYLVGGKYNQRVVNLYLNGHVDFFLVDDVDREYMNVEYKKELKNSYIEMPSSYKDYKVECLLKQFYKVKYDMEIIYNANVVFPTVYLGEDFSNGDLTPSLETKEVVVYSDNIKNLVKDIYKLDYMVSIPSQTKNNNTANLFVLYLLTGVIFVALFIMFFITYAVIQRIYLTKTKDYSIFRTLGLISSNLKKMLHIEVLFTVLVSTIVGFGLSIGLIYLFKTDLHKYISIGLIIIYILVMIIFSFAISLRLNKKIFKNTVFQGIKEGSE